MLSARLNLLVALPSEARPINQLLNLRRLQPDGDLPLYGREDIVLVLTGHGMQAAEAGVRYLHQCNQTNDACWLNIGIAGHAELPLGQAMIASEIIAPAAAKNWKLDYPMDLPCIQGTIQTVFQPVSDYPDQSAYDMEASGFVATALEYVPISKIHVLKIISDNLDNPSHGINAKMVRTLIQGQSILIKQLVKRILREHV